MAKQTSVKIVGIGSVDIQSLMVANAMLEKQEILAVHEAGGSGEMLGHFLDAQGQLVETELSERTMGLIVNDLAKSNTMAIAGGSSKVLAICSILNSSLLSGLINDECTACALIDT